MQLYGLRICRSTPIGVTPNGVTVGPWVSFYSRGSILARRPPYHLLATGFPFPIVAGADASNACNLGERKWKSFLDPTS